MPGAPASVNHVSLLPMTHTAATATPVRIGPGTSRDRAAGRRFVVKVQAPLIQTGPLMLMLYNQDKSVNGFIGAQGQPEALRAIAALCREKGFKQSRLFFTAVAMEGGRLRVVLDPLPPQRHAW